MAPPLTAGWTHECESLLAEWSEKASCFRWLHARCEKRYRTRYYAFAIPVIILSTLTGFANVGMSEFLRDDAKPMASAIVGGVNLLAGVLGTLQSFLKVAETMESHRASGVAWSKLGRNISIELALDPARRAPAADFLAASRSEYDRLTEQSPAIDDSVIAMFKARFSQYDVAKPAVCNGLDRCTVYKVNPDAPLSPELSLVPEPEVAPEPASEP
eukprot:COSAG02_NODE_814_length_16879_cov_4.389928_9_plen_215_part_00